MNSSFVRLFLVSFVSLGLFGGLAKPSAGDWVRWRGPNLNGISSETGWLANWPDDGPRRLWKAKVGTGFSSIAVANGKVYTIGNSGRGKGEEKDTVFCFDATTGKVIWSHAYEAKLDPKYYAGGPSGTPTVDGDRVYTLSKHAQLICFGAADGHVVWQKNIATETRAKRPTWGFAGSPLVIGGTLFVNVGAHGTALDKKRQDSLEHRPRIRELLVHRAPRSGRAAGVGDVRPRGTRRGESENRQRALELSVENQARHQRRRPHPHRRQGVHLVRLRSRLRAAASGRQQGEEALGK
jgi:hypothetical protein